MHLEAGWNVVGVVVEKRELTSEKNKNWRGYVCKVATFGLAAEIMLTRDLFAKVGEGEHLRFSGRFDDTSNGLKLMAERVERYSAAKGGAA